MYWPIGASKVYAASKHTALHKTATTSNDGLGDTAEAGSNDTSHGEREEDSLHALPQTSPAERQEFHNNQEIVGVKTSRNGHIFATITRSSLTIWQTKPTAVLATVTRSEQSLQAYGTNTSLLLRPDALIVVVQTTKGFLVTYSLATDPNAHVYQTQLHSNRGGHARRQSMDGFKSAIFVPEYGPAEGDGIAEVNIRFRMVIRIDAGLAVALVLDDEVIVATTKPSAIQRIRWSPDSTGSSHSTELLKRMSWLAEKTTIVDMAYDRPMNLHVWIASDGRVYAVQQSSEEATSPDPTDSKSLFNGYCFHDPENERMCGTRAVVNARFSLIAVGCADSTIRVYTAKDYIGNIPLLHTLSLPVSAQSSGALTFLSYSPDGYCLFAGFDRGWAMWSVYGKPGAHTFSTDQALAAASHDRWLGGVVDGFWVGGGCEIMLLGRHSDELSLVEMARSSATGCFAMANLSRSLLQGSTSVMLYRGLSAPDITAIGGDAPLWQTIEIPQAYVANQWPMKHTVTSPDGKYVAVAGRRGLAHHSVNSGRWKTFEDPVLENEFTVRGGMCWYLHILVAGVETGNGFQIRLYSREKALDSAHVLHTEELQSPAIHVTISGADSLLVYTYDNILFHYVFVATKTSVRLAQVGQIAFHGIIRAPARVRAINWIIPDEQRDHGEPSQDVATASVLFLVDGKLVLLQPSANELGNLKYDMRVIAHNVEHYSLAREQPRMVIASQPPLSSPADREMDGSSLRDSLWYFDGKTMRVWPDILDVLASAPSELDRELPPTVSIPVDFYPLSAQLDSGVLTGLESDLVQRRDVNFAYARFATRTHLFIPALLRHHLAQYDSSAALHLSNTYQALAYFAHALEILLHNVLDDEVDAVSSSSSAISGSSNETTSPLAMTLSFLSSFPAYLSIVVNCARKTELRSWPTLFRHLPPVRDLFEASLVAGELKTAGGFLLVLHAFDEHSFEEVRIARLLRAASLQGEWDLCKELARFLVGVDAGGGLLRAAVEAAGLRGDVAEDMATPVPYPVNGRAVDLVHRAAPVAAGAGANGYGDGGDDYFGLRRG